MVPKMFFTIMSNDLQVIFRVTKRNWIIRCYCWSKSTLPSN